MPPPVREPHSQKMFISKSIQVCLEAPAPKHHPAAQNFKIFLASTVKMDANIGTLSLVYWILTHSQATLGKENNLAHINGKFQSSSPWKCPSFQFSPGNKAEDWGSGSWVQVLQIHSLVMCPGDASLLKASTLSSLQRNAWLCLPYSVVMVENWHVWSLKKKCYVLV